VITSRASLTGRRRDLTQNFKGLDDVAQLVHDLDEHVGLSFS